MMENKTAVRAFLALGQETRLNIFRLIVQRGDTGLCPSQLQELLGVPGATLSFHLRELCAAGLLLVQRQSRNLVYRADADFTQSLQGFLIENCCGGQACELTSYQFDLLLALAERAGRVLSRDQIMDALKGHPMEAFERSIDVHVSRIRACIEDDAKMPKRVLTVRGSGYVFARKQDADE
jgi:DNA-binding response OmpR family regulator